MNDKILITCMAILASSVGPTMDRIPKSGSDIMPETVRLAGTRIAYVTETAQEVVGETAGNENHDIIIFTDDIVKENPGNGNSITCTRHESTPGGNNCNCMTTDMYRHDRKDRSRWMEGMEDSTRMCKISIPATHDSGSLLGGKALQTQDMSIEQQLESGIRGFDIRLQAIDGDRLGVFHSTQFQNQTWEDDVLPAFIRFLKENPSEALVVSLKREGGSSEDYCRLLSASLSREDNRKYFVDIFKADITLGSCRGRILFLHRDKAMDNYPGAECSNWGDNTTCDVTLTGSNGSVAVASVQDEYQYNDGNSAPYKVAVTMKNIMKAMTEPESSDKWFISFASATALPADGPEVFSDQVNPALAREMEDLNAPAGIIMIDFAGDRYGSLLTEHIIESNF